MKAQLVQQVCAKCGNGQQEAGEMRVAGGMWSKFFNVQGKRFSTLTCTQCGYTELYKKSTRTIENVADVLTGF
ncbi:MAG: GTP-binding protein [Candidatus Magasanikbacteria bacterium CG10_big_fil_rev_8_21_14_0_10_47_10]|uniref:GTP-binding protein n=1 Tax=Candidatus Magasanikbacteria bacterium CG10_big_fil_rev_8_21_14_0_10_47_10 TaxID=1974652 RepID=A0A2H0TRV1_9BACT|nr:MAG: GTP-binding protein [Candidatus Magasanikbacteria bacterium CG10_big_fil_rev_8_21_14_0_10_47_10]